MHQYRAAYELAGTEYSDFAHVEADVALRQQLVTLDTRMLAESHRIFAGAANIARRLHKYNGLSAETLYHPPALADRVHRGPQGDYVLVVSRIESVKRIDLVVEAMTLVRPGIRLVVAGDGTQRENVRAAAERLGVADRVRFLGAVAHEDVPGLLRSVDVVACMPWYEPFGIVPLEAAACGRPVVGSAVGGLLDTVVDGRTGLLVPAQDADALVAAVGKLLDPATRLQYGAAARVRAEQLYGWGTVARRTAELYVDVVARVGADRRQQLPADVGDGHAGARRRVGEHLELVGVGDDPVAERDGGAEHRQEPVAGRAGAEHRPQEVGLRPAVDGGGETG
jgi:glycosyltransferase involved in cell wall biosynthesis